MVGGRISSPRWARISRTGVGSAKLKLDAFRAAHFGIKPKRSWQEAVVRYQSGNKPTTINRYLASARGLFRIARDEWQWVEGVPKIRLLAGEVERDRWLTREEASRLIACCPPHMAALVRFAVATGCRAREITGLEGAEWTGSSDCLT